MGSWATKANAAFDIADRIAETKRTRMGLKISGILKSAKKIAPRENPICTAMVSHEPSSDRNRYRGQDRRDKENAYGIEDIRNIEERKENCTQGKPNLYGDGQP